jgi:hypothetical protein
MSTDTRRIAHVAFLSITKIEGSISERLNVMGPNSRGNLMEVSADLEPSQLVDLIDQALVAYQRIKARTEQLDAAILEFAKERKAS